jgi:PAS domain S-box-containing protein
VSDPHEPERGLPALDRLAAGSPAPDLDREPVATRARIAELTAENARLREENRRLRDNEAHYRELFDATYDGIFVVDVERGRILEANEPACRLVGYAREELRALTIADLHPYDLPHVLDFAEEVRRHGRWQTRELTCRARSGEVIPAEMFATAVVYDGRPCILVLAHDLREHRLAQLGLTVSKIGHLNAIEREVPAGKVIHAILDNYAAHQQPKVLAWLARHPRWTFHFTPTSGSWLNPVETFFSALTRRRLKRRVFRSIVELQAAINRYLAEHNQSPQPFVWTSAPTRSSPKWIA